MTALWVLLAVLAVGAGAYAVKHSHPLAFPSG